MEYLPAELVEEIASYLNHEDVEVCSRVSLRWEQAFNLDRIWKRFLTIDKNYFEKKSSKMNYSLSSAKFRIEPCHSKELLRKELFIKNNFMTGNFETEEIDIGPSYLDCIKETIDKEGNHWLFASLSDGRIFMSEHTIKVWNINQSPLLHTWAVTPLGKMSRPLNSQMKFIGDRLFHINENLVLVYQYAHPQYELKFLYKIEFSKSRFPAPVFISLKMIFLSNTIVGFAYTNYHIYYRLPPTYEVWNHDGTPGSNNCEQLRFLQNVGFTSFPNVVVKKNDRNNVIVVCEYFDVNQHNVVLKVFDCITSDYTDISVHKQGKFENFDVLGNVVILFYTVRDQNSSEDQTFIESFNIEDGSSLFCTKLESETRGAGLRTYHGPGLIKIQFMIGGDVISIVNKVLSVYKLTATGLSHVLSFELAKRGGAARSLRNSFIIISFEQAAYYELYNYKTGDKMYRIELPRQSLSFSFKKKRSFPTNLIAYSDQNMQYAQPVTKNSILIISFW